MSRIALRLGYVSAVISAIAAFPLRADPLHVDITQGVSSPLMIAVPDLPAGQIAGIGTSGEDSGAALSRVLRDDLTSTGLYRLVSAAAGVDIRPRS